MSDQAALSRIRVVLVRTSHPGNIGAAARALKNMGLSRLYLVEPRSFPDPEAVSRASGATDVLDSVVVTDSLQAALQGVSLAAALTARRRELAAPMQWAREAAGNLFERAVAGEDVALVFGNETFGLSNEDLALCQVPVMIPANPEYSSLNLGAAVQVMAYELRMAQGVNGAAPSNTEPLATIDEVEALMTHIEQATIASGFFNPANPKRLMPRLRRMFGRITLERDEVNILRGMLSYFERPLETRLRSTMPDQSAQQTDQQDS